MPSEIWNSAIQGKNWKSYINFLVSIYEKNHKRRKLFSKPYILFLDSVSYCNLHCPFCPTGARVAERESGKLAFEKFSHLMDHIGKYIFELRFYNWGEPLLNNDIPKMIKYAKKFHMVITISSNLSIPMTEEKAEEVVDSGLDYLICAIDGVSQETYEKYRRGGDYEMAMKNIVLLNKKKKEKNSKTPEILWQFLVFKHNQHEIEKATLKANELGIQINFQKPYISESGNPDEWISTLPQFSKNVRLRNLTKPDTSILNCTDSSLIKQTKPCTWLWSTIAVSPTGSISPCGGIINERDDFGEIKTSVLDVWNNQKYIEARNFFKEGKKNDSVVCCRCPVQDIQQTITNYDKFIIQYMFSRSGRLARYFLNRYLRYIQPDLLVNDS